jgi:hypothetical protein
MNDRRDIVDRRDARHAREWWRSSGGVQHIDVIIAKREWELNLFPDVRPQPAVWGRFRCDPEALVVGEGGRILVKTKQDEFRFVRKLGTEALKKARSVPTNTGRFRFTQNASVDADGEHL